MEQENTIQINVSIPVPLDKRFREFVFKKYNTRIYGNLKKEITLALESYLDTEEKLLKK